MRYVVDFSRSESKEVAVFADSPHEAYRLAVAEAGPGWRADNVIENPNENEFGESFIPVGGCEACGKVFFDGDRFESDGEYQFCPEHAKPE